MTTLVLCPGAGRLPRTAAPTVAHGYTDTVALAGSHLHAAPYPDFHAHTASAIATVKARALNVRAGPGVKHAIVGYAAFGQSCRITCASADRAWLRIDLNGLVRWVSARWVEAPEGSVYTGQGPGVRCEGDRPG